MTIQCVNTDGMSHYHHMAKHEIYIINLYLKQLETDIPWSIDAIM